MQHIASPAASGAELRVGAGARPTPTANRGLPKILAGFDTLTAALDYAARGETGFNFYAARGTLAQALPFRDLRDRAIVHALKLSAAGLRPGDRVALLAATSPEFLTLFFACQYAGVIPVPMPLPTAFGRREAYVEQIRNQIASATPRLAFGPADFVAFVQEAASGTSIETVGAFADVSAWPEGTGDLAPGGPAALSYIQYSSGSTRFPTGVMVTHAGLMANCRGMNLAVDNKDGERAVSWLPFFHDMGLVGFMLAVLASQTSTDYLATEDFARRPMTWLKLISENRGTMSFGPSFGYELCARRAQTLSDGALDLDLSCWRVAGIGGEMIKPQVMQLFGETFAPYRFSLAAFNGSYGLAECTLGVSFSRPGTGLTLDRIAKDGLATHVAKPVAADDPNGRTFVGCGVVIGDHQVEIRDEAGGVLGERGIGRVFVRGPSVMPGYYNDPDATAATLIDGWLDTGDLGYWLGDQLVIVGRAKDMMIVNGRNVWPQDIEWTVEHLDGMRSGDSAAIVLIDGAGNERPTILVQCRPIAPADRARLAETVKARVAEAVGITCDVVLVPPRSLPKTSSGKLARGKAKAMFERGEIAPLDATD
ncbi:MAG: fatty acyl-AMP ligase [Rhodospirillaceae bacterium]|nr:fatty acyl-AMP ligase [Rhodospirillaceae bacterium]